MPRDSIRHCPRVLTRAMRRNWRLAGAAEEAPRPFGAGAVCLLRLNYVRNPSATTSGGGAPSLFAPVAANQKPEVRRGRLRRCRRLQPIRIARRPPLNSRQAPLSGPLCSAGHLVCIAASGDGSPARCGASVLDEGGIDAFVPLVNNTTQHNTTQLKPSAHPPRPAPSLPPAS